MCGHEEEILKGISVEEKNFCSLKQFFAMSISAFNSFCRFKSSRKHTYIYFFMNESEDGSLIKILTHAH